MLSDLACRNARPMASAWKLADGESLYLWIAPSGTKVWRWKYRLHGKEKLLTIGRYPAMGPKAARAARDQARAMLENGMDPSAEKKRRRAVASLEVQDSFESVARAWHRAKAPTLSSRYAGAVLRRLELNAFPSLGARPLRQITPPMVLAACRMIEAREAPAMAHRVCNHISDVFVWGIASGLAEHDPAATIRKALAPKQPRQRPAMLNIDHARALLIKTEAASGVHYTTLLASRLLALTACRPGVVRMAEPHEFEGLDGPEPLWRVPAAKMKLTQARKNDLTWEFVVPLSAQAVEVVQAAMALVPVRDVHGPLWLFSGIGNPRHPISDNTLSKLYREAGFQGLHVPHGWRATFSTLMNKRAALAGGDDGAVIELMLAHVQSGVAAIYNRYQYLPRRRELAQVWADMLMAGLLPAESLLPEHRPWRAPRVPHEDGARHTALANRARGLAKKF